MVFDGGRTARMGQGALPRIGGGPVKEQDRPVHFVHVAASAAQATDRVRQAPGGSAGGRR
ncbi:MAG: hypothetical protein HYV93_25530 [Candidatus Rokubacteria bacterium]|nr:hypothetical protein [Candidatus Rokubacteria bacterium]